MTRNIKDNLFAAIIASDAMAETEKISTLASLLKIPQGLKAFDELHAHLNDQRHAVNQGTLDAAHVHSFSLLKDLKNAHAMPSAARDFARVIQASDEVMMELGCKANAIEKLLSTAEETATLYRVLQKVAIAATMFHTADEIAKKIEDLAVKSERLLGLEKVNHGKMDDIIHFMHPTRKPRLG